MTWLKLISLEIFNQVYTFYQWTSFHFKTFLKYRPSQVLRIQSHWMTFYVHLNRFGRAPSHKTPIRTTTTRATVSSCTWTLATRFMSNSTAERRTEETTTNTVHFLVSFCIQTEPPSSFQTDCWWISSLRAAHSRHFFVIPVRSVAGNIRVIWTQRQCENMLSEFVPFCLTMSCVWLIYPIKRSALIIHSMVIRIQHYQHICIFSRWFLLRWKYFSAFMSP